MTKGFGRPKKANSGVARVALILAVALPACLSSSGARGPSISPRAGASPSVSLDMSLPAVRPEPAPSPSFGVQGRAGVFAGDWHAHGSSVQIDEWGFGSISWRVYVWCDQHPPPCDTRLGGRIFDGGEATIVLSSVGSHTASGRIVASSVPDAFPVGPLSARLDTAEGLLYLSPQSSSSLRFVVCGPQAAPGACGA
jgi:hypothetical protein